MTPTEAKEFMAGTFGPARARTVITKLADQVEALTRERDDLKAIVAGKIKTIVLYRVEMLGACKGRDALAKTLEATERKVDALIVERNELAAAAKLALDVCLDMRRYGDQRGVAMAIGAEAALRQAGVQ